jgi:hypothetical protein
MREQYDTLQSQISDLLWKLHNTAERNASTLQAEPWWFSVCMTHGERGRFVDDKGNWTKDKQNGMLFLLPKNIKEQAAELEQAAKLFMSTLTAYVDEHVDQVAQCMLVLHRLQEYLQNPIQENQKFFLAHIAPFAAYQQLSGMASNVVRLVNNLLHVAQTQVVLVETEKGLIQQYQVKLFRELISDDSTALPDNDVEQEYFILYRRIKMLMLRIRDTHHIVSGRASNVEHYLKYVSRIKAKYGNQTDLLNQHMRAMLTMIQIPTEKNFKQLEDTVRTLTSSFQIEKIDQYDLNELCRMGCASTGFLGLQSEVGHHPTTQRTWEGIYNSARHAILTDEQDTISYYQLNFLDNKVSSAVSSSSKKPVPALLPADAVNYEQYPAAFRSQLRNIWIEMQDTLRYSAGKEIHDKANNFLQIYFNHPEGFFPYEYEIEFINGINRDNPFLKKAGKLYVWAVTMPDNWHEKAHQILEGAEPGKIFNDGWGNNESRNFCLYDLRGPFTSDYIQTHKAEIIKAATLSLYDHDYSSSAFVYKQEIQKLPCAELLRGEFALFVATIKNALLASVREFVEKEHSPCHLAVAALLDVIEKGHLKDDCSIKLIRISRQIAEQATVENVNQLKALQGEISHERYLVKNSDEYDKNPEPLKAALMAKIKDLVSPIEAEFKKAEEIRKEQVRIAREAEERRLQQERDAEEKRLQEIAEAKRLEAVRLAKEAEERRLQQEREARAVEAIRVRAEATAILVAAEERHKMEVAREAAARVAEEQKRQQEAQSKAAADASFRQCFMQHYSPGFLFFGKGRVGKFLDVNAETEFTQEKAIEFSRSDRNSATAKALTKMNIRF